MPADWLLRLGAASPSILDSFRLDTVGDFLFFVSDRDDSSMILLCFCGHHTLSPNCLSEATACTIELVRLWKKKLSYTIGTVPKLPVPHRKKLVEIRKVVLDDYPRLRKHIPNNIFENIDFNSKIWLNLLDPSNVLSDYSKEEAKALRKFVGHRLSFLVSHDDTPAILTGTLERLLEHQQIGLISIEEIAVPDVPLIFRFSLRIDSKAFSMVTLECQLGSWFPLPSEKKVLLYYHLILYYLDSSLISLEEKANTLSRSADSPSANPAELEKSGEHSRSH